VPSLKLATFNINNIAKRLAVLLEWLTKASPDIVCLQELKVLDARFPLRELEAAGYGARWVGQPSWNGVAILAKGMTPVETRGQLRGDPADTQSRYLEAAVHGVLVGCLYAPNGNPQPGPKFAYKLAWMHRLLAHAQALFETGHPVALVGDYNVVPTDFDIYKTRSWLKNALLQPEPRALYQQLLGQGWTDAIKATHPDEPPTRSGTTCDRRGSETPACASITSCSAPLSPRACATPGLMRGCGDCRAPAIMLPPGRTSRPTLRHLQGRRPYPVDSRAIGSRPPASGCQPAGVARRRALPARPWKLLKVSSLLLRYGLSSGGVSNSLRNVENPGFTTAGLLPD